MKKLFVQMPLDLLMNKRLTRSSVILMTVLMDIADSNGIVDRTIDQLARYTGLSEKTVRRSERELCDIEAIRIERTGRSSLIMLDDAYVTGRDYSAIVSYLTAEIRHAKGKGMSA